MVILDSAGRLISGLGRETADGNGFGGGNSVVADIDDDGAQELVTGTAAYELDGALTWANGAADGYTAIADFDDDELPELVVIANGFVRIHDAGTGALLAQLDMPGVLVGLRVHGHGLDAHASRRLDDATGDLATVGDEDLLEHACRSP